MAVLLPVRAPGKERDASLVFHVSAEIPGKSDVVIWGLRALHERCPPPVGVPDRSPPEPEAIIPIKNCSLG
jgi:hypothetical protein